MRNFIAGMLAAFIGAAALGAIVWIVVLPRLDWAASNPPGPIEQELAGNVLARWIHSNAHTGTNPVVPTSENLKTARTVYEAHCAACHGLDGRGRNQFEAEFNPPVAKLTGRVQKLSDSELYFIVAHPTTRQYGKRVTEWGLACVVQWDKSSDRQERVAPRQFHIFAAHTGIVSGSVHEEMSANGALLSDGCRLSPLRYLHLKSSFRRSGR
jgi:hypothetical protein